MTSTEQTLKQEPSSNFFLRLPVASRTQNDTDSDADAGVSLLVNDDEDNEDEQGWNDIEGEEEGDIDDQVATCPICEKEFLGGKVVFKHLARDGETGEGHGFDVGKYAKEHKLDFYGTIKLVNYLRTVKNTDELLQLRKKPEEVFLNEQKYLQPVLEDDPLLYAWGDLLEDNDYEDEQRENQDGDGPEESADKRIRRLQEQLSRMTAEFEEYKRMARRSFQKDLEERIKNDGSTKSRDSKGKEKLGEDSSKSKDKANKGDGEDADEHYFKSYAGNDIHETMLKDAVRTDSYRDFIYSNKHLFKDRTVLDIGCGTGILSMFCARAGAKKVYAVDNSAIIEKARLNIYENNLQDVVTCIKGKIEDVTLPVKQVDIIISEWMGYCLLYEAMLDSVIFAREKYLKPDGLMVPSYTTLVLSPLHSHELVNERINLWNDVYGFKMTAMKTGICEDVLVDWISRDDLASETPVVFKVLDLHQASVDDVCFKAPFEVEIFKDLEEEAPLDTSSSLTSEKGNAQDEHAENESEKPQALEQQTSSGIHGFLLWFDTFFTTNRSQKITTADRAETWKLKSADSGVGVCFTTGPFAKGTHWKQGALLVDMEEEKKHKSPGGALKKGDKVRGNVVYRKRKENNRELEIEVEWRAVRGGVEGELRRQMWLMR